MSHVTVALAHGQFEILQRALADAVFYRDPPLCCPDCEAPGQLCGQCAAGLSQARAYLALSRELAISSPVPKGHPGDPASPATQR
jgi:hypothetical protein